MAKRSDRRARERTEPAAPPAPAPPSRRQFWLGVLVAAAVLVPIAIIAVLVVGGGDDADPAATVSAESSPKPTPTVSEADQLKETFQVRNQNQVSDLTAQMRGLADELDPVVAGIDKTFPFDQKKLGPIARRKAVEGWVRTSRKAEAAFEETVSGETGVNIARGTLAAAVRGIANSAETYRLALDATGKTRSELLKSARNQRDDAINAWETAGAAIDVVNIAVGFGHQHPGIPGSSGTLPDDSPEGSGATGGG